VFIVYFLRSLISTTITIHLEPNLQQRLDQLAVATQRSKSLLATEALRDFIELNEWQLQEIEEALKEADNGDFASDTDVKKTFGKWGVNATLYLTVFDQI
jgi:RHH-type rel operon transcriptional repressor/antitoxin RelB